jgi:ankyrin repeat protein
MLPQTLEKTYDRILNSITEQDSVYAIKILRWLTFAERPLSLDEIAEAVAVIEDRDPVFDEDEVLQDPLEALDICSSLITIRDSGDTKESPSQPMAVLAHYTVKEYLLSPRIRGSSLAHFSMHYEACHSILARACVGYLRQHLQQELEHKALREGAKLLNYCVEYWMIHVEEARDLHAQTTHLVVNFLARKSVAYLNWLHLYYSPDKPWTKPVLAKPIADVADPLYYAALFRLGEVVRLLLENGADANAQGGQHGNALSAAAGSGHEGNVKLLLTHGARVDQLSPRYGSALQVASEVGHGEVVKLLLAAGGDVNLRGGLNGNALELAIGNQHTAIVSLLLENGAQVEPLGCNEISSLTAAAYTGNLDIVKLLISYGAAISAIDSHGWTPVNSASVSGHFEIVEMLIQAGADMNTASKDGWTPINSASSHGLSNIVGLLLSAGADHSIANENGWTPLIAAVDGGHYDVVRLLLEHDASRSFLNAHSKDGHTALSRAAGLGYTAIVKLLLAKGVSTVEEDLHGKQAFAHAVINGSNAILTLLNEVSEAGPDHRDRFGRSALWWAAAFDRPDTVKLILNDFRSNPSIADNCGRTPLSIAMKRGNRHIINLLEETSEEVEAIELVEDPMVVCDVCEFGISDSDLHFNCSICARGDWDICAECKDHGMTCLDHTHTLTKRTIKNDRSVESI